MQYDTPVAPEEFNNSLANNPHISEETRSQIEQILGTNPGGNATKVDVGLFDGTTLQAPSDEPIEMLVIAPPPPPVPGGIVNIVIPQNVLQSARAYVFETNENIQVTFNTVERVVVSGQGHDLMTVNGDRNTTLDGSGGNDTLVTSGGNDSVTGGDGNDSISAAAGNDTIVSGLGEDTIDGGAGRDMVRIAGDKSDYTVTLIDGELRVTSKADASVESKLTDVEFVSFDNGDSIAVAADATEATMLRLYQGVLGRDADEGGATYWINEVQSGNISLSNIAAGFLHSAEYSEITQQTTLTDEQYIDALYANALGRAAEEAGKNYWLNELANNQSRADVAIGIVGSPEATGYVDGVIIITGQI
ncbi:DUF4214 domain-containing protein [Thauera aromatica]|uniref:DUF4214 domain-containing protein n=1 Tax=Thauera aromatica TaxID=59405 RepID=UPI001FFD56FF|nr:DUF4214 domain-containing protein [Thauera aromatica]MCK2097704.1 DUF4214 domain-containing protein [Thauera aromatica]